MKGLGRLLMQQGTPRGMMLAGVACRLAQSLALGLAFAVVIGLTADVLAGRDVSAVRVTALMSASLLAQIGFGYLSMRLAWLSGFRATCAMRLALLAHLRRLPLGFHASRNRGDSVSALSSDMEVVQGFLSDALPQIAQSLGLPLVMLVFLLSRDAFLGGVAGLMIALALPLLLVSARRLGRLGITRQDRQAEAAAAMIEYVQGLHVLRAFDRRSTGEAWFHDALARFRDISTAMIRQLVGPMVMTGTVLLLGVPAVMAACAFRLGDADAATLVAVLVLILSLYAPLMSVLSVMELARLADAALARIDRILDAAPLPQADQARHAAGFEVRFENVGFSYGDGPVLRDVDFTATERSTTAIVGPSGAGKSTLLDLIARFWDVQQGRITIGGTDVRDLPEAELTGLLTIVFQDGWLFAGTIRDNILMGHPEASDAEVEQAARAAQAHDFIAALPGAYDTLVGEGGATLSGGERQRIAIARAILKNAPIVLLDEATAAIDASNDRAIQTALTNLVAARTVIIVAHKLSTICHADQILVLKDGAIIERGRHLDLLGSGRLYPHLWRQNARN